MGAYRRCVNWFAGTRVGAGLIRSLLWRVDRTLYRLTNGRLLSTGPAIFPTLLLTTVGRRSGRARTVPLLYVRDGERLVVGTVSQGRRRRPAWVVNLRAEPRALVRRGATTRAYRARVAVADEVARLWPRLVAIYPA